VWRYLPPPHTWRENASKKPPAPEKRENWLWRHAPNVCFKIRSRNVDLRSSGEFRPKWKGKSSLVEGKARSSQFQMTNLRCACFGTKMNDYRHTQRRTANTRRSLRIFPCRVVGAGGGDRPQRPGCCSDLRDYDVRDVIQFSNLFVGPGVDSEGFKHAYARSIWFRVFLGWSWIAESHGGKNPRWGRRPFNSFHDGGCGGVRRDQSDCRGP